MRSGICVKCREATVYVLMDGDTPSTEEGVDQYFCTTCGYKEDYLTAKAIPEMAEGCPRVVPTGIGDRVASD